MNTTRKMTLALLVVCIFGGTLAEARNDSRAVAKIIRQYNFQGFQPPRNSIVPGTLVVLDKSGSLPALVVVCKRESAYPGLPLPKPEPTITTELKGKIERSFKIDLAYLKTATAGIDWKSIKQIDQKFSNVSVLENTIEELYGQLPNRTEACQQAVRQLEAQRKTVLTVQQALQGDLTYVVTPDISISAGVGLPEGVLENLRVTLGGTTKDTRAGTITGSGLVWGLRPERISLVRAAGASEVTFVRAIPLSKKDLSDSLTKIPATIVKSEPM